MRFGATGSQEMLLVIVSVAVKTRQIRSQDRGKVIKDSSRCGWSWLEPTEKVHVLWMAELKQNCLSFKIMSE